MVRPVSMNAILASLSDLTSIGAVVLTLPNDPQGAFAASINKKLLVALTASAG